MDSLKAPFEMETAFDTYTLDTIRGEGGAGRVYGGVDGAGKKIALKLLTKSPTQKSGNENNGLKYDRDSPFFARNAENRAFTALNSSPLQAERIITY
jgi:hypothetical protein